MARRDIEFDAEGVTLRGWFYPAEGASGRAPTVVMAHGFSAVKEMYLDSFAEVFAAAALNALVFDNRNFGASDGDPRQEIDPWAQVRDYRHAITYAGTRPDVDPSRIGVWGSSYSGGHVLVVAAIDRRVKAVVSQVPLVSGSANIRDLVRADFRAGFREMFDADRAARYAGDPPAMVPVVAEDPLAPSALPTRTPGRSSPRPARPGHRPGATRSPCAPWRCSGSTNRAATWPGSARRRCSCSSPRPTTSPRRTWPSTPTSRPGSPSGWSSCPAATSMPMWPGSGRRASRPGTGSANTSAAPEGQLFPPRPVAPPGRFEER